MDGCFNGLVSLACKTTAVFFLVFIVFLYRFFYAYVNRMTVGISVGWVAMGVYWTV